MEIYIANINELPALEGFPCEREFKSEKRKRQFCAGRFLAKHIAQTVYGLADTGIQLEHGKPYFAAGHSEAPAEKPLYFSISHSGDFVAVCFDRAPVGFDAEHMVERDFAALIKRYAGDIKPQDGDIKTTFYKFWCEYEAKLKLQAEPRSLVSFEIMDNYMAAVASAGSVSADDIQVCPITTLPALDF